MIVIVHENNKVKNIHQNNVKLAFGEQNLSKLFFEFAKKHPNETIVWCHQDLINFLNYDKLEKLATQKLEMTSYSTSHTFVISDAIGYIEQASPFININFKVKYPTWRMSSDVGCINTQIISKINGEINETSNFEYFLNSLAKLLMPNGLLCYSNPKLLKKEYPILSKKESKKSILFKFVKQHYKGRWLPILSFNFLIYETKFSFYAFFKALFYKKRVLNVDFNFDTFLKETSSIFNVDVIIPTIGRKKYLFDVLSDLNKQTILPKNVIIIEQNQDITAISELDYIKNKDWKFNIIHEFIHQTGACNARNIALEKVTSNWVFFADDDIRMDAYFIEKSFNTITNFNTNAITVSCLLENEIEKHKNPLQWATFGSGCSIVNMSATNNLKFDMAYEHGFGEDADFGMQLRNQGIDIIYAPSAKLLHLKAPFGGFRTKFKYAWKDDIIQPKPSPTVLLYNQKHNSKEQLLGYKTLLFIKFYKLQSIKNPIKYFRQLKKRWEVSKKWSEILSSKNEV